MQKKIGWELSWELQGFVSDIVIAPLVIFFAVMVAASGFTRQGRRFLLSEDEFQGGKNWYLVLALIFLIVLSVLTLRISLVF